MADVTAQPRTARRSPLEIAVDRVWRFFCSVRAAVYEIVILAVLVLLGTLRGSEAPRWLADALPFTGGLVDRWYAWDVFHSLPFMLILGVLSVAITICTLNRVPGIWHTISRPSVRTSQGFLRGAEVSASFQSADSPESVVQMLRTSLRGRRYRVLTEKRGDEIHFYADRNRFAKLGTFPFHLALILILVGGIVGARYGFREKEFIIPEGSIRPVGHGTDISVGLERFSDSYRQDASPQEYRSDIVIYDNGKPVKHGSLLVNHPMTYHNMTFYQSSFGQAVSLRVTDKAGKEIYNDSIPLGVYHSTANPDAPAGVLDLPEAGIQLNVIAPDENPTNMPQLDTLNLESGQMFIQARRTGANGGEPIGAIVGQGSTAPLGGINVTFVRERRFTLLQVGNNPGIPIFFVAAFLMVGGLAVTFYFPHRRIRGIIALSPATGGATATLAPLAKRDWSGRRDFDRLLERLRDQLGDTLTIHEQGEQQPERALGKAAT
ncbi:MAG TPA: cytochrome c biogenesis protein ResB [Thermomicrobiales bacterium]|nr:cytochrome c biogenesis protein ResB [Thermomicrobiales bacterium]